MSEQLGLFAQTIGAAPFRIGSAGKGCPGASSGQRYITMWLYLDRPGEETEHRSPERPRVEFRIDTGWKIEPGTDREWYEEVARYFATTHLDPREPKTMRGLCYKRSDDMDPDGSTLGYGWSHIRRFNESQAFHEQLLERRGNGGRVT